jgi:nucleoside-diphosphate-sugar epimerase
LILRLSGFVGPNLKKNAAYDVACGNPVWVDAASEFQYLHTTDLASLVLQLASAPESEGEILNVGARGTISVTEMARIAGRPLNVRPGSPLVRCEVALDRLARFCEVPSTKAAVKRFFDEYTAGAS